MILFIAGNYISLCIRYVFTYLLYVPTFIFVCLSRTSLPVAQFSRGDFSLWSVLKNCVGKELSKITMPVVFNEPLSFLQRMLEYLEYAHLLRMASEQTDPVNRMEYIAGKTFCPSFIHTANRPWLILLQSFFLSTCCADWQLRAITSIQSRLCCKMLK